MQLNIKITVVQLSAQNLTRHGKRGDICAPKGGKMCLPIPRRPYSIRSGDQRIIWTLCISESPAMTIGFNLI